MGITSVPDECATSYDSLITFMYVCMLYACSYSAVGKLVGIGR